MSLQFIITNGILLIAYKITHPKLTLQITRAEDRILNLSPTKDDINLLFKKEFAQNGTRGCTANSSITIPSDNL